MRSILSARHIGILTTPERWRVRATCVGDKPDTVLSARHAAWYKRTIQAHSQRELLVALSGTTRCAVGEGGFLVQPGTILLFDSMEPHQQGYPDFEGNLEHLWISMLEHCCTAALVRVRAGRPAYEYRSLGLRRLPQAVQELASEIFRDDRIANDRRRLKLNAYITLLIARILDEEPEADTSGSGGRQRQMMRAVQRHMEKTAGHGDSLDSLARIAGYSRFHFARVFKSCTGMTVQAYRDHCRRRRVRELQAAGMRKKEMGYALGFAGPQSFSRWLHGRGRDDTTR